MVRMSCGGMTPRKGGGPDSSIDGRWRGPLVHPDSRFPRVEGVVIRGVAWWGIIIAAVVVGI